MVQSKIKFDHVGIDCIKIVFVYQSSKSIVLKKCRVRISLITLVLIGSAPGGGVER